MLKLQKWLDRLSTAISAVMLAVMMAILVVNIILRYTPGVGGVSWYMESTQYLNVWAMFIVGIAICVRTEHLNVNLLLDHTKGALNRTVRTVIAVLNALFYLGLAYGTGLLASRSKQAVSTMPYFHMSQVYWLIPAAALLSAASVLIGLFAGWKTEDGRTEGTGK
jgi:TRAP-type C4-dicarboxylate transport system permease small subunit